jgi:LPXTG-motif cell wall-anchored protein
MTATPTSTPTATPTATVTSTPTPTGTPNYCGGTCGSNSNCQGGLFCNGGYCRNPQCPSSNDCNCSVSTPTVPPVLGVTAPPTLPKTGGELGVTLSLFGLAALGVYIFRKLRLV